VGIGNQTSLVSGCFKIEMLDDVTDARYFLARVKHYPIR
jgi:hypothetical protein